MKRDLHNIDKLFNKAIEEHSELPSENVWSAINKGLENNKVVSIEKRYFIIKRVAIALLIVGFASGVFALYLKNRNDSNGTIVAVKTSTTDQKSFNSSTANQQTKINADNKVVNNRIPADDKVNVKRIDNSIKGNSGNTTNHKKIHVDSYDNRIPKAIASSQKDVAQHLSVPDKKERNTAIKNTSAIPSIAKDGILYSHFILPFSASFAKSTNRSNITTQTLAGFSKLKNLPRLSISLFASPQKAISHLKDNDDGMRRGNRDEFRSTEKNSTSYSTGILVDYPLKSNISIGTGIIYSSTVTDISPKTIVARPDGRGNISYEFNCSAGYTYIPGKSGYAPLIGDSARAMQSHTRISYVSVPLNIGYNIEAGKFIIKPTAGLLLNFLSHGNIESTISSSSMHEINSKDNISGLKPSYVSGSLNVTGIYKLSKKLGIMVAPNSQFAITSINKNTGVKTYPVYLGISGGLHVSF